jgi:hypothetical protein
MAETVYKKISELPNATLPLAGTEYIELSATGASKRGLWSGLFGSGWWAKLAAAFSAFKAPDADHADNADTLSGIDPVNGNAGTDMPNFILSANSSWIIPKGLYVIATYARLEIYSNGAWYGGFGGCGFILSDGVNFRLTATSTPDPVSYRKLA